MPSSGSTPSPSGDAPIRLLVHVVGDDHARACTGRRLIRGGWARQVPRLEGVRPAPVVLDPFADEPLSRRDRATARRGGLLVIDCSWNVLSERGGFPTSGRGSARDHRRRLPWLIAANPQHYGRLGELNTVEALAAALRVLGWDHQARSLLGGAAGGAAFLEINAERLDRYATAPDGVAVRSEERELFGSTPGP